MFFDELFAGSALIMKTQSHLVVDDGYHGFFFLVNAAIV